MPTNFNWACPYCDCKTTITEQNYSTQTHFFNNNNKLGRPLGITTEVITCPNNDCKEYCIKSTLKKALRQYNMELTGDALFSWNMRPQSVAICFPDYVPTPIKKDYEEACLIKDLSPKASATLSRRCLQGVIRDFWSIKKNRLIDEINALKDEIDPLTWQAIDSIRSIGNIGAHMEKDINLVINVDPEEAQLLIRLIEILIKDWYVTRHERQKHLKNIVGTAHKKSEQKKENNKTTKE